MKDIEMMRETLARLIEIEGDYTESERFKAMDELSSMLNKQVRQYKRNPSPEKLKEVRKTILAVAALCRIIGNDLGYQYHRFSMLPELESWKPRKTTHDDKQKVV